MAEQPPCKRQVVGSTPTPGSDVPAPTGVHAAAPGTVRPMTTDDGAGSGTGGRLAGTRVLVTSATTYMGPAVVELFAREGPTC